MRGTPVDLTPIAKWSTAGTTVFGGIGPSSMPLYSSISGIFIDDNFTVYSATNLKNIVARRQNSTVGTSVAGSTTSGIDIDQFKSPADVIIDPKNGDLIVCDAGNNRVVRWHSNYAIHGEVLVSGIACSTLLMDHQGFLYVNDVTKHEIRKFNEDYSDSVVIAGGNGAGTQLNQLNQPSAFFIHHDGSLFICDTNNHRVLRWVPGDRQGTLVAGSNKAGNGLNHLYSPAGVVVTKSGSIYISDTLNYRIVRWNPGATEGRVIFGGSSGSTPDRLNWPKMLSFDRSGNLYVTDSLNRRIQRLDLVMA